MKTNVFKTVMLSLSFAIMMASCKKDEPLATTKDITAFVFTVANNPSLAADVTGTISGNTITLSLPSNAVVSALKPTITHNGASISPASNAANDFSTSKTYTVTAADGSAKVYTIALDFAEENFFNSYIATAGFVNNATAVNGIQTESGLFFNPLAKGKITKIKVRLPDINPSLRVTIWKETGTYTVLRTETVNVSAVNTEFIFDIADIDLDKNAAYAITMNSNDAYSRSQAGNASYPITAGNIKINAFKYLDGATQLIPTQSVGYYYFGDLSFDFKRTE